MPITRLLTSCLALVAGATVSLSLAQSALGASSAITGGTVNLVGDASFSGGTLHLTPDEKWKAGAAWIKTRLPLDQPFETSFQFRLRHGSNVTGADGFAFVIQNYAPFIVGLQGGFLGYDGIPRSVAVEFDTWRNSESFIDDPNDNHIAVMSNSQEPNRAHSSFAMQTVSPTIRMADGATHTVRIQYEPGSALNVFLDNATATPDLSVTLPIMNMIGAIDSSAWIGLTGATGELSQTHEISNWSVTQYPIPSE